LKIGFVNVYAYRPHGHHASYLANLCRGLGYKTYALDCFGAPESCYVREYKGVGRSECVKCSAGGLHTFDFGHIESIREYWDTTITDSADEIVRSSAYTLTRIESFDQRNSEGVQAVITKLSVDARRFYSATRSWICEHSLNTVFLFNGRMDYTRAVLEACRDEGITCITHERPLYGHGIILNRNENCSSLTNIHRINRKYHDKPLSADQAAIASSLAAQRLIGGNQLEWKLYNQNPSTVGSWPISNAVKKILVCPSSKNELLGHPDWETPWSDNTDAIDRAVSNGLFSYNDLLVRFHPSWASSFGAISAEKCEVHYQIWCNRNEITFIPSGDPASTKDLIRMADAIVLNGSNTILEAGMLGKPVICFGPAPYSFSGAATDVLSLDDIDQLDYDNVTGRDPIDICTQTLRYFYNKAAREPLFTDFVRSKTVTECDFFEGAAPEILKALIDGGCDIDNDEDFGEERVMAPFLNYDRDGLEEIAAFVWYSRADKPIHISRRGVFKVIDAVRNLRPKGV